MKHKLLPTSNIYPQLNLLLFMNLLVGDDNLTGDKDWKHVFKRFRNLLLRAHGVVIHGIRITPAILRSHFQAAGFSASHIHSLFNPDDKQDVKLAFDMLKDLWSLPAAPEKSTPGFVATRSALHTLGKFFYHIIFPYLCVNLTLSEQLEHLSAAAHLALVLYREAGKEFLPTLLYTDVMIMIKNVFFCAAKVKHDDPEGEFWLILLGTDRLEELFGILRTMIGNDANLDILQLSGRLTGTTEISNILAKYPHWDRAPRRLKLPAITRDSRKLPDKADHIKPASWRGDVTIKNVTLSTCWKHGRRLVEEELPFSIEILTQLSSLAGVDILSPFGILLVKLPTDNDGPDVNPSEHPPAPAVCAAVSREFEDAAAEEEGEAGLVMRHFDQYLTIDGQKVSKTRMLSCRSKYDQTPSSTDRLRRVQNIEKFPHDSSSLVGTQCDSIFGEPCLITSEPIATLVRYDSKLFLCIGEVNAITVDSKPVEQLRLSILPEQMVKVSFQILGLVPATSLDDPSLHNDWRTASMKEISFTIPGRLVQAINPDICSRIPTKPYYLLRSPVLMAFSASLFERLAAKDLRAIPTITTPTQDFPYRETSGVFCQ